METLAYIIFVLIWCGNLAFLACIAIVGAAKTLRRRINEGALDEEIRTAIDEHIRKETEKGRNHADHHRLAIQPDA
jgi:hypothetical protein